LLATSERSVVDHLQAFPKRYVVHAVYPSRRGLLPSVRALLDYLGARFSELRED
jgi:DNA-binding transcriptional LysR family regulator